MNQVFDINCNHFARGNDYVDFIETSHAVRLAESLPASPAELPDGCEATFQLTPPLYASLAEGIADNRSINDALIAAAGRMGGFAAGVVEPKYGEAAMIEIERIAGLGAKAVVWSARAQGVFVNDQLIADLCQHASAHGLVPMIHSAPFSINESLERVWSLARKCGSTPLVVVGALASWENAQAIADNGGGPDNLFYDLTGLSSTWDLTGLVRAGCSDRLLFASGGPRFLASILGTIEECGLDPSDRQAILSGNAAALLNLSQGEQP
ncbi:MAG: amidohydrolase family protein [Novosphingobium sp.]|nr:amidohydrolase family protein [Novosphingobium sp.]